tara:strand:+ start:30393 stop:30638 length:246 start_codon:yes stop_codon:yes gene_type:complete
MDPASLKIEFDKQLKDAEAKIAEAEKNLKQLNEYKTKLLGGLETLELLSPKTQDGVQEQSPPLTEPEIQETPLESTAVSSD